MLQFPHYQHLMMSLKKIPLMTVTQSKRAKNSDAPEVTSKYYLSNSRLLPAVLSAKASGKINNELASMLMMLARKYAQRPCFNNYSYKEDMISEALTNLCQNALKFNPEKSSNPFSYYTSCIHSSFLQFLNVETKHRRIRDQLLVELGENPSYSFADEMREQSGEGEYRAELTDLKQQIEDAGTRLQKEAEKAAADAELARLEALLLESEAEAAATIEAVVNSLLGFDDELIEEITIFEVETLGPYESESNDEVLTR
jgi:hypothetical protein